MAKPFSELRDQVMERPGAEDRVRAARDRLDEMTSLYEDTELVQLPALERILGERRTTPNWRWIRHWRLRQEMFAVYDRIDDNRARMEELQEDIDMVRV